MKKMDTSNCERETEEHQLHLSSRHSRHCFFQKDKTDTIVVSWHQCSVEVLKPVSLICPVVQIQLVIERHRVFSYTALHAVCRVAQQDGSAD